MTGDAGPNQLLGRPGADTYRAGDGDDSILANSGTPGLTPTPSSTAARVRHGPDRPARERPRHAPPIECEAVEERDPNSFRPPDTPPDPEPEPPPRYRRSPRSRRRGPGIGPPPQTRIATRPRRLLAVAGTGRDGSSSPSPPTSRRRLPLQARPQAVPPLPLPPRLPWSAAAPHTFRVFAIDAAGNRDRSPALFAFRVRRR